MDLLLLICCGIFLSIVVVVWNIWHGKNSLSHAGYACGCSPQNKTEAVENTAPVVEVTHQKNAENDAGSDTVKIMVTVHLSFKEAEFAAQGKHYFVEKDYGLMLEVQKKNGSIPVRTMLPCTMCAFKEKCSPKNKTAAAVSARWGVMIRRWRWKNCVKLTPVCGNPSVKKK